MKVILLKDVAGIGQKDSIQSVSDGHALNYLIPNKLAVMATAEVITASEKRKQEQAEARAHEEKEWEVLRSQLRDISIAVQANAGEQGNLYEKVSEKDISRILRDEKKIFVPISAIHPKMPIKHIGEWPVEIRLGNHTTTIIVTVTSTK